MIYSINNGTEWPLEIGIYKSNINTISNGPLTIQRKFPAKEHQLSIVIASQTMQMGLILQLAHTANLKTFP